MRARQFLCLMGIVLGLAGVVVGATFFYTGEASDNWWDSCENWDILAGSGPSAACYPSTANDLAGFLYAEAYGDVCLITETVREVNIDADVTFDDCEDSDPVLTINDILLIVSREDGPTTVTFSGGAKFQHTP